MSKISAAQKKILIISSVVLLTFLLFLLLIYLPSKNSVAKIKAQLLNVQGQIQATEAIIGRPEAIQENMRALTARWEQLDNKFPEKEEESLRALSQIARKLNIEIISIQPRPKDKFLNRQKQQVILQDKTCQGVYVAIQMRCFYKDLVKYIQTIKESLPAFLTVEGLKINKPSGTGAKLHVKLEIYLYLLS